MNSRKLALGSLLMAFTNVVKIGLQFVLVPVIAKLVGPAEYGLFGLAMPVVMLVMSLADAGLGDSLAREKESNHLVWSSACWVLLIIASILIPGVIGASFIQGLIAHQPRLTYIVMALSVCLLFFILSVPSGARLFRRGQLGVPAVADMTASIIGAIIAIVLAMHGAGVWSLVSQNVSVYGIRFFIQFIVAPYFPGIMFSWHAIRPHLLVGGSIVGVKVADLIERNIENVLIGRALGTGVLGIYSLANQIPSFVTGAVGNIIWVNIYARALHAPTGQRQAEIFKKFFRLLALLLFPISAVGIIESEILIKLFLEPEWATLPHLMEIFLLSAPINALAGISGAIFLANGKSSIQLRINVEANIVRATIALFAAKIGILGCVIGFSLVSLYTLTRCMLALRKLLHINIFDMFMTLKGIVVSSILSAIVCLILKTYIPLSAISVLLISSFGACITYFLLMLLVDRKHLIPELEDVWRMFKKTPPALDGGEQ